VSLCLFGASFERRPNARCLGQRFISARLSGLGGDKVTSVCLTPENGNISVL